MLFEMDPSDRIKRRRNLQGKFQMETDEER